MNYFTLLGTVAPVFIILASGYAVARIGWLGPEADSSLLRVVVNLLFPCLILDTVLKNSAVMQPGNLFLPPLLGFGIVGLGYLICYFLAPLLGIREPIRRRTFAFTAGIPNYGYFALPVVQTLFGSGAVAVLLIHNVGVEIVLWTAGIAMLSGTSPRDAWRHIFNPPVLAILAALALHFAGAHLWMPSFIITAIHSLGLTAVPLGLLLTGATFAEQARNLTGSVTDPTGWGSCVLRLGILPLTFLALARWLPLTPELRGVLMVQAAMPSAVVPVILAKHYGGEPATALRIVLFTSALGLITIPLWLKFGMHFLGLDAIAR